MDVNVFSGYHTEVTGRNLWATGDPAATQVGSREGIQRVDSSREPEPAVLWEITGPTEVLEQTMTDKKKLDFGLELIRAGVSLAGKKEVDHLLFISDLPPTDDMIKSRSPVRKKLIHAVTSESQRVVYDAIGAKALLLPAYDLSPDEKIKIAMAAGMSGGWFKMGEVVVALISKTAAAYPDALTVVTVGDSKDQLSSLMLEKAVDIPSQVMEAVLELALSIAEAGWEGHPIGTILVVGDVTNVMEKSRQLTLNPFQGYSEAEKNLHNPRVRGAIENFAVLDGAFVIREDGVVLAAGRYLNFDPAETSDLKVPLGLGARHTAAAGITRDCDAIAVVVSQGSGVVSVFENGRVVMRLESKGRRSWDPNQARDLVLDSEDAAETAKAAEENTAVETPRTSSDEKKPEKSHED